MKLLIVTPYFYPKIGGLENYAYNYAQGLRKKFHWEIVIITSNHISKKNTRKKIHGLTVYRLATLIKISNTPVNPLWYFQIKNIIKNEKPDIINAHTPVPFIAEMSALASGNIPFILTYHALSLYKKGMTPFNFIIWLYKRSENYLFYKASKIIVVSKYIKEMFPNKITNKIITINNSVDTSDLPRELKNKKNNSILFVGSLDKTHNWKGLDAIIKSIKLLKGFYNKKLLLIVVGDGNQRKFYENMTKNLGIEKFVKFVGAKTEKSKIKYFKNAQIAIVYPKTSNDALPTFLLEAWAYKLPVIGSNILPISKIIKNNFNGLLVQPSMPTELANAIHALITKEKLRNKLALNGYKKVKNLYDFEYQLTQYNKLLIKTISI